MSASRGGVLSRPDESHPRDVSEEAVASKHPRKRFHDRCLRLCPGKWSGLELGSRQSGRGWGQTPFRDRVSGYLAAPAT